MAYDNLDIDYGAGNGARATSDDALPGDWPLDLLSELANSSDYESLRQEDIEHLLLGTTDPNAEESIIERESTISFVSHPDEMECDVPASNQDIDMEPYDDFQLVTTQASTAHVSDLNEPQPPHSNLSLNPPSGLQDAGAQTGMGMWADSLPIINVQPPRAMPDLGHQEVYQAVYQAGPQTDTIAAYQYGHDTIAAPAKYATDNMQSIPFLWAEAGTRPYNPNPDFQSDMMLDHADIKSPYPEPWNNLDRGETHNAYTTQPSCGCPGTSSHVPHASSRSVSTLPWTGTSASTSSSAQLDLSDSMMTVRPPDSYQRLPQCPHGNPITYFLPESEHGAAHETPATFAQLGRQQSYTGEDARSVDIPLYLWMHADRTDCVVHGEAALQFFS